MTAREVWFVTPPKGPWNFVQSVHPKGWATMIGFIASLITLPAIFVTLILITLNPIWVFGVIASIPLAVVPFMLAVHHHLGREPDRVP